MLEFDILKIFTVLVIFANSTLTQELSLEDLAILSLFGCTTGICCYPPANFPTNIQIKQENYANWAGTIKAESIWVASPANPDEVVDIVNWAHENGYKVRPVGFGLGWSPLAVSEGAACENVIAVRTSDKLKAIQLLSGSRPTVRVQTGASMDDLTKLLSDNGYALSSSYPVAGHVTVGGVISGGGHGTGVPAGSGNKIPGFTFGSISNLVLSLTAVVWDGSEGAYVLKTFNRNQAETKDLIVNLGRAFLTEVRLLIGPEYNLECHSSVDISIGELYKNPNEVNFSDRTFASLVESSGSISSIWFAFTTNPWIRTWNVMPDQPRFTKKLTKPYAYPFSDTVGPGPSMFVRQILSGAPWLAPAFGNAESVGVTAGLLATSTFDVWGKSVNSLLYVRPTTLQISVNGYAIHTKRQSVQRIVSAFTSYFFNLLATYKAQGKYPVNIGHELRLSGQDVAADLHIPGAEAPSLAPSTPFPNNPEFDVVLWLDTIFLPGTRHIEAFGKDLENFLFYTFSPDVAIVRPEWSKGFAFSNTTTWANLEVLRNKIPSLYANWDSAQATLTKYDPNRVFTNDLLDILLPN